MSIVDVIKHLVEHAPGFVSDAEKAEHLAAAEALRVLDELVPRVEALEKRITDAAAQKASAFLSSAAADTPAPSEPAPPVEPAPPAAAEEH